MAKQFGFKNKGINRIVNWVIYPSLIINLFFMVATPEYRTTGFIYLAIAIISLIVMYTDKNGFYGMSTNFFRAGIWGLATLSGFLVISKLIPSFTLLIPSLPFSILSGIRFVIIVLIAPPLEEILFNSVILTRLIERYGLSFLTANSIKSGIFGGYHITAYGIILGALDSLIELFGQLAAISGLIITSVAFSFWVGYLVYKYKDVLVGWGSHTFVNGALWTLGFVIVTV